MSKARTYLSGVEAWDFPAPEEAESQEDPALTCEEDEDDTDPVDIGLRSLLGQQNSPVLHGNGTASSSPTSDSIDIEQLKNIINNVQHPPHQPLNDHPGKEGHLRSILSSPKSFPRNSADKHSPLSPVSIPGSQTVRRGSLTLVLPPKPKLSRRGSTPYNFKHIADNHKLIPDASNFLSVQRNTESSISPSSSFHDYTLSEAEEEGEEHGDDPLMNSHGSCLSGLPESDFHHRIWNIRSRHSFSRYSECSESPSHVSMISIPRRKSRAFTVINYGDVETPDLRRPSLPQNKGTPFGDLHEISKSYDSISSNQSNLSQLSQILPAITVPRKTQDDDGTIDTLSLSSSISWFHSHPRLTARRSVVQTQTTISLPDVARRGLLYSQRKKNRLVNKDGVFNISYSKIDHKGKRYLADSFTTMLDMRWRYTLLMVIVCFLLSWVAFALFWWLISYAHKDHIFKDDPDWVPCVVDVYDFPTALLFSIETQHTIGYGSRATTPQCTLAMLLMMAQSIFGIVIQCVTTGVFLAKLARPKRRGQTIMFSKTAVICQEDGEYVLAFRVGDMRTSQLVSANLHAVLVKKRITEEGEEIPFHQCRFDVKTESEDYDQFIFLSWPIRVVHKITETSPLWNLSPERLLLEDFEIIVVLEGVVESTGMTTQVRTSYLPAEILWGYRLAPLLTFRKEDGSHNIDYSHFNEACPVNMPEISAKRYNAQKKKRESRKYSVEDSNNNEIV